MIINSYARLRPALAEDKEFLFELYASTRREEVAAWGWDAAQQHAFLRLQFQAQQQHYQGYAGAEHVLVLDDHQQPIGHVLTAESGDVLLLVDIALLPAWQGAAIGTALIRDLQSRAARRGQVMRLHVLQTSPACRLYQRLGFALTGEDGMYYEMEWRADNARPAGDGLDPSTWQLPWPEVRVPPYRPARQGAWAVCHSPRTPQFGYFQARAGPGDVYALLWNDQTWMATGWDELESQAPHVASARGHVVVMGAGLGVALYNLLPRPQVNRVTLVERDPLVLELLRQATDLDTWPGRPKLEVDLADALEYRPARPVDSLYVDIWAKAGRPQALLDVQQIQARVRAGQVSWWGQEIHFLQWLAARGEGTAPSLAQYRDWARAINLPLIEQDNPAYVGCLPQVARSYTYQVCRQEFEQQAGLNHQASLKEQTCQIRGRIPH